MALPYLSEARIPPGVKIIIDLQYSSFAHSIQGISSPGHPSHAEACKYSFLVDFGTLNTNLKGKFAV